MSSKTVVYAISFDLGQQKSMHVVVSNALSKNACFLSQILYRHHPRSSQKPRRLPTTNFFRSTREYTEQSKMRIDLVRKETPDESWRKGLFLSPPRKAPRRVQSAPPRMGVRFAPDATLIQEHVNYFMPLCEEERASLWYTREEYALMRRSSSFTVRLLMELQQRGTEFLIGDDEEMCIRGLEGKTRTGARRRRHAIVSAIDAVLVEQERQWDIGLLSDVYGLARVYREASAQCAMEAWLTAQEDAKAVQCARVGSMSFHSELHNRPLQIHCSMMVPQGAPL